MVIRFARFIGPSRAGLPIGQVGTWTKFWVNGLSFDAVVGALTRVWFTDDVVAQQTGRLRSSGPEVATSRDCPLEAIAYGRFQPVMIDP